MRINLQTPFADKDKAKSLGARWDAAQKVWYIVDVADLTPFMRWIPNLEAARSAAASDATAPNAASASKLGMAAKATKPAFVTRSTRQVAACACVALPWEDCIHTTAGG